MSAARRSAIRVPPWRASRGGGGRSARDRDGSPQGRDSLARLGAQHDSPAPKGIPLPSDRLVGWTVESEACLDQRAASASTARSSFFGEAGPGRCSPRGRARRSSRVLRRQAPDAAARVVRGAGPDPAVDDPTADGPHRIERAGGTEFRRPSALVVRLRRGFAKQSIRRSPVDTGRIAMCRQRRDRAGRELAQGGWGTRGPVPGTHGAAAGARPGSAVCPGFRDRFRTRGLTRRSWWRWPGPVRVSGRQYRFAAYSRLHRARSHGPMRSVGSLDLGRGDTSMSATQTSPGTAEACTSRGEWTRTPSPRWASRRSRTAYRQAFLRRCPGAARGPSLGGRAARRRTAATGTSKTPGAW